MSKKRGLDEDDLFGIQRMSKHAHGFLNAYGVLKVHNPIVSQNVLPEEERKDVFPADIVCVAFSVEVGLKTLIAFYYESMEEIAGNKHNLLNLFESLPIECQQDIRKALDGVATSYSNDEVFKKFLDLNCRVFVDWRYAYEKNKLNASPDFLVKLSRAILSVVDDYYKQAKSK